MYPFELRTRMKCDEIPQCGFRHFGTSGYNRLTNRSPVAVRKVTKKKNK